MTNALLNEFPILASAVKSPAVAFGSLEAKRTLGESVLRMLMSSGLGVIATMFLWKERYSYLVLAEDGLHWIDFRGEEVEKDELFPREAIQNVEASVDEQWVRLSFTANGEPHSFRVMRYQLASPDGSVITDTELMKQVGNTTKRLAEELQA